MHENEVGIKYKGGKWIVFATDERASIVTGSIFEYDSEEEYNANRRFIKT